MAWPGYILLSGFIFPVIWEVFKTAMEKKNKNYHLVKPHCPHPLFLI